MISNRSFLFLLISKGRQSMCFTNDVSPCHVCLSTGESAEWKRPRDEHLGVNPCGLFPFPCDLGQLSPSEPQLFICKAYPRGPVGGVGWARTSRGVRGVWASLRGQPDQSRPESCISSFSHAQTPCTPGCWTLEFRSLLAVKPAHLR